MADNATTTLPPHGNVACIQSTDSNILLSAKIFKFALVSKHSELVYPLHYVLKCALQATMVCNASVLSR